MFPGDRDGALLTAAEVDSNEIRLTQTSLDLALSTRLLTNIEQTPLMPKPKGNLFNVIKLQNILYTSLF